MKSKFREASVIQENFLEEATPHRAKGIKQYLEKGVKRCLEIFKSMVLFGFCFWWGKVCIHEWVCFALFWFEMVEEVERTLKETINSGRGEKERKHVTGTDHTWKPYGRAGHSLLCCLHVHGSPLRDSFNICFSVNSPAAGPRLGAVHRGCIRSCASWSLHSSMRRWTDG